MKKERVNKLSSLSGYLFLALICSGLIGESCFAYDDEGFQYWSSASASFDINKDWKATFEEEFRLGDDGGHLYYNHSDLGFTYKSLADWIDLGFNYRQVFEKDSKGKRRQENRPHLNITLKGKLFDLDLSNRARFEYRDRENKEDVWWYRNKTTVKFPLKLTNFNLQPYVADEVFITLNDDNVDRNRFYAGASFNLSKDIQANIFYLWQSSRSAHQWKDINVLGTQLKFLF